MDAVSASNEPVCDKRYHHGDLRRALLAAADAILERSGPDALSLRAVAREAGVSPAAPYHHFKDKDELIAAVASEGFARLNATVEQAWRDAQPGGDAKGVIIGLSYVDFAQAHPALYRVMYDCARKVDAFPSWPGDAGFVTARRDLEGAEGPPVSDMDIQLAVIAAWCTSHGLAEMRGFTQFQALKDRMGGEKAFLRGVLEHMGLLGLKNAGLA